MKKILKNSIICLALAAIFIPGIVFAHQPRIAEGTAVIVTDPEVSKAYYGALSGQPHIYKISSEKSFHLYVNLLVPDRPGQNKDVSADIVDMSKPDQIFRTLNAEDVFWTPMYEEYGGDDYFKGPEFTLLVAAGNYEIRVRSANNDSRYALAIGSIESFPLSEIVNALVTIPKLKSDFFGTSPFTFLLSRFGILYVLMMVIAAFVFGLILHALIRKFARGKVRKAEHNIGFKDRILRAVLGLLLLIVGVYFWNPVVLFFAGFCFFEAIFSWCGLYAALGKNSCPL